MLTPGSTGFTPAPLELRARAGQPDAGRRPGWTTVLATALCLTAAVGLLTPGSQSTLAEASVTAQAAARQGWSHAVALAAPTTLEQELVALRAERDALALEVGSLRRAARERDRLRDLLQLEAPVRRPTHAARLVGSGTGPDGLLRIDAGGAEGVSDGHAVLGPHGLVGTVVRAAHGVSDVLPLTHRRHAVQVEVVGRGVRGTAFGTGDGLSVAHILPTWPVEVGDQLETTGLGGVFPAGVPVAEVVSVDPDPDGPFLKVSALPLRPPAGVHEVLVLTDPEAVARR